jgi:hypothetical protein
MLGRASNSLGPGRIDEDDRITQILPAGLEQDRGIQNDRPTARFERPGYFLDEPRPHQRMNDRLERTPSLEIRKNDRSQGTPIDARAARREIGVIVHDRGPKAMHKLLPDVGEIEDIVPHGVGVDRGATVLSEQGSDCAFAAGNAACQTNDRSRCATPARPGRSLA